MGYQAHLQRMLHPLGIYASGGYQAGELAALGAGLDGAEETLSACLGEVFPSSARGQGKDRLEELFPLVPGLDARRSPEETEILWRMDNGCFDKERICQTLSCCGIKASVMELSGFQILVIPEEILTGVVDPVYYFWLMEQIFPCHLLVSVSFDYLDTNTGKTVHEQRFLGDLRKRSRAQWEELLGAYI